MKLFSYCVAYDGGSAPNPFGNICTLAICKPKIRANAVVGDWVVGIAGSSGPWKDRKPRIVYAMKVTKVLSMREYDRFCKSKLAIKIPKRPASSFEEFVGDCIYKYRTVGQPELRPSVHLPENMTTDLGGKNVLLSTKYCYFGSEAKKVPTALLAIVKTGRGHQSRKNEPHIAAFELWINRYLKRKIYGRPIHEIIDWHRDQGCGTCAKFHMAECR